METIRVTIEVDGETVFDRGLDFVNGEAKDMTDGRPVGAESAGHWVRRVVAQYSRALNAPMPDREERRARRNARQGRGGPRTPRVNVEAQMERDLEARERRETDGRN